MQTARISIFSAFLALNAAALVKMVGAPEPVDNLASFVMGAGLAFAVAVTLVLVFGDDKSGRKATSYLPSRLEKVVFHVLLLSFIGLAAAVAHYWTAGTFSVLWFLMMAQKHGRKAESEKIESDAETRGDTGSA